MCSWDCLIHVSFPMTLSNLKAGGPEHSSPPPQKALTPATSRLSLCLAASVPSMFLISSGIAAVRRPQRGFSAQSLSQGNFRHVTAATLKVGVVREPDPTGWGHTTDSTWSARPAATGHLFALRSPHVGTQEFGTPSAQVFASLRTFFHFPSMELADERGRRAILQPVRRPAGLRRCTAPELRCTAPEPHLPVCRLAMPLPDSRRQGPEVLWGWPQRVRVLGEAAGGVIRVGADSLRWAGRRQSKDQVPEWGGLCTV